MSIFHFKYFSIKQDNSAMKVGTDAMLLGSFVDVKNKLRALDIGAGTGVLSCMLAQQKSNLFIDAIEIEDSAFSELVINIQNSSFSNQINPIFGDVLAFQVDSKYDLIVSNPPYFEDTYLSQHNVRNLARHIIDLTPNKLMALSFELLSDNGDFWVIIPAKNVHSWLNIAENTGLYLLAEIKIMGVPGRHVRSIIKFSKQISPIDQQVFVIRDSNGNYTDEYKVRTEEFHLNTPSR